MKQKSISMVVLGAFLLGISLLSVPAQAQIKLTYANFPPAPTFPCVQMEEWKKEVEKRTGGKVAIQTFPGSTLLNPKNMFEGVISGTADIGCLAMSYQPGRFPLSEGVDQPVGFSS
ncbi:MAG: C4-dicarboxylate ABC transporter substrate-binding protein, partial [Desulfobacterales bacterium]|nr:C4-dicarboxylate ABC transporter substrate-binding protein [Desulfobacterales bacterium]